MWCFLPQHLAAPCPLPFPPSMSLGTLPTRSVCRTPSAWSCMCVYMYDVCGAWGLQAWRKAVAGRGKRKRAGRQGPGTPFPSPGNGPDIYFSPWCLGSWGFMGPPSPAMISVALNCVSPLMDAAAALPRAGRRLPTTWAAASLHAKSDPGSHSTVQRVERWQLRSCSVALSPPVPAPPQICIGNLIHTWEDKRKRGRPVSQGRVQEQLVPARPQLPCPWPIIQRPGTTQGQGHPSQ